MIINPFIKICGIKDPSLAEKAVQSGAHFIGITTYQSSKRYVDLNTAQAIAKAVKKAGGIPVAVFIDYLADDMQSFCNTCDIDVVQLHSPIAKANYHKLTASFQRIYALSVNKADSLCEENVIGLNYLDENRDFILFDNTVSGSSQTYNLTNFKYNGKFRYFLAGGLTPYNVSRAIQLTKPHGIDVLNGVKDDNENKDLSLIQSLLKILKIIAEVASVLSAVLTFLKL